MGVSYDCKTNVLSEVDDEYVVLIPKAVTPRQARLALLGGGLLSGVETALNGLSSPAKEAALIEWEYATEIRRDSPLVTSLGAALNLNSAQIDALFVAAAAIE